MWGQEGKRQKLTCPLTTKFVFNIVSLSGKEFNEFILVLLHDALTLSAQGRKQWEKPVGAPLFSTSREEDKDMNPTFHLGSPITPLIFKNQLPIPIAHRELEGATDVWINSNAL